jgi:hypothetical protein
VFLAGALASGTALYAALGALGSITRLWPVGLAAAAVLAIFSIGWHVRGRDTFRGDNQRRQARRDLAVRPPFGLVYFGALLGFGLVTAMSTPLVYAGAAFAFGIGGLPGACYGFGFALGRSVPGLAGVILPFSETLSPVAAGSYISGGFRKSRRSLGVAAASALLLLVPILTFWVLGLSLRSF